MNNPSASLPLIVKGICHPDDARRAIDGGGDPTRADLQPAALLNSASGLRQR
jgi:hypothetical protein